MDIWSISQLHNSWHNAFPYIDEACSSSTTAVHVPGDSNYKLIIHLLNTTLGFQVLYSLFEIEITHKLPTHSVQLCYWFLWLSKLLHNWTNIYCFVIYRRKSGNCMKQRQDIWSLFFIQQGDVAFQLSNNFLTLPSWFYFVCLLQLVLTMVLILY